MDVDHFNALGLFWWLTVSEALGSLVVLWSFSSRRFLPLPGGYDLAVYGSFNKVFTPNMHPDPHSTTQKQWWPSQFWDLNPIENPRSESKRTGHIHKPKNLKCFTWRIVQDAYLCQIKNYMVLFFSFFLLSKWFTCHWIYREGLRFKISWSHRIVTLSLIIPRSQSICESVILETILRYVLFVKQRMLDKNIL